MSWIVRNLVSSLDIIERNIVLDEVSEYTYQGGHTLYYDAETLEDQRAVEYDFDSLDYTRLMRIKEAVKLMFKAGILTKVEIDVLNCFARRYGTQAMEKELSLTYSTIYKFFVIACNKISFYLGGEFTDVGYFHYMVDEHKLTEEQQTLLKEVLQLEYI